MKVNNLYKDRYNSTEWVKIIWGRLGEITEIRNVANGPVFKSDRLANV